MKQMHIIKRSGQEIPFDINKIENAIRKAADCIDYSMGLSEDRIRLIAREVAQVVDRQVNPVIRGFRNAAANVVRHNRRIRDEVEKVSPFYSGDPAAAEPAFDERIERVLNPKNNGADELLADLARWSKRIMPGEYPEPVLNVLKKSTRFLLHDVLEKISRVPALNKLDTIIDDLDQYLRKCDPMITQEAHAREIDRYLKLWKSFCLANSDDYYDCTTKIIETRRFSRESGARKVRHANAKPGKSSASVKKQMIKDAVAWRIQEAESGRRHSAITTANHLYALMKADPNLYIGGYTEPTEASKTGANDPFVKAINNHTPKAYKCRTK